MSRTILPGPPECCWPTAVTIVVAVSTSTDMHDELTQKDWGPRPFDEILLLTSIFRPTVDLG